MLNLKIEMVNRAPINRAYTKEMFLDLMDNIDAFGIKVLGVDKRLTPDNYVIVTFSDGSMMFHKEQWDIVLELWDIESINNVIEEELSKAR